jgi:hypothetical protein
MFSGESIRGCRLGAETIIDVIGQDIIKAIVPGAAPG